MGFSNTSKHLVCMWMKIQELHGIKSLRDIQKTKPKLIAIEPKLIANPYGRPCAPFQGLSRLKLRWKNGDGPGILYPELGNCILCVFNVSVVERPLKIESHFVAREFAHRKTTCKNPISFCSRVSCPSEGNMWKPNLILSNHFQSSFCSIEVFPSSNLMIKTYKNQSSFCSGGVSPSSNLMIKTNRHFVVVEFPLQVTSW